MNIENLKKKIDDYFKNTPKEQIEKDLKMIYERVTKEERVETLDEILGLKQESQMKENVFDLVREAIKIDGAHHKQWYLIKIAKILNIDTKDCDPGISP